jgi:hypothetical protein
MLLFAVALLYHYTSAYSAFIFLIRVRGIKFYLGPLCGNDSCYYRCCLCTPLLARQKINVFTTFLGSAANFQALNFYLSRGVMQTCNFASRILSLASLINLWTRAITINRVHTHCTCSYPASHSKLEQAT